MTAKLPVYRQDKPKTIRQRFAEVLLGDELKKLANAFELANDVRQYRVTQEAAINTVMEMDSQLVDLILRQRGWTIIGGRAGVYNDPKITESDRLTAIGESRWMHFYDVQTFRAVQSWTDFGFGQFIGITIHNPLQGQAIWDEFWNARRNSPLLKQRKIQQLSNDQIIDGEQFFVFYTDIEGLTTIRRFPTEEIIDIIYQDDNKDIPLFYVRSEDKGRILYPDWQADEQVLDSYALKQGEYRADQMAPGVEVMSDDVSDIKVESATKVVVLHAALNERDGRGWPQFTQTFPWTRAYKEFLQDRATVAKSVAASVDEIIHKGGSRAQEALINTIASNLGRSNYLDSNPPPVAGSSMVHNDALTVNRRPLVTGASDAEIDGMTLLGQVSAGDVLPLHWRGRPDAMQNRATAREQERPWLEAMQRYQTFWKDVFRDMVEIVLMQAQMPSPDADVEISMQTPFIIFSDEAAEAMGAINESAMGGTIDYERARVANESIIELMLTSYGVENARKIMDAVTDQSEKRYQKEKLATAEKIKDRIDEASELLFLMNEGEIAPFKVAEAIYAMLLETTNE